MPENKNQHYVPKSYFRLFSKNGTHVELYNMKHQRSFTASINHMCSKDYFYSKDAKIESVLSGLENSQNKIMRTVINTKEIPKDPRDYIVLTSFVCLQHARTETAKMRGDESMKLLSDEMVTGLLGENANAEITFPKIHLMKMQRALQSIPLLADLVSVVLINKTQKDFIFSDNPVVFHNTALNKTKDFGILGLQSPGLQIFCPLDDKTMLMLYDPKFYSVKIKENYSLEIVDENDVEQINVLQFLNCNENIFYSEKSFESDIHALHKKIQHLVGKRRMKKKIIPLQDDKEGRKRDLLHMYEERPKYDLKLSFVDVESTPEFGIVRNQKMIDVIYKDMDKYDRAYSSKLYRIFYNAERTLKHMKFRIQEWFRRQKGS